MLMVGLAAQKLPNFLGVVDEHIGIDDGLVKRIGVAFD
jgi:hypothetical protein